MLRILQRHQESFASMYNFIKTPLSRKVTHGSVLGLIIGLVSRDFYRTPAPRRDLDIAIQLMLSILRSQCG